MSVPEQFVGGRAGWQYGVAIDVAIDMMLRILQTLVKAFTVFN